MAENQFFLQYLGCSAFIVSASDGTAVGIDFWTAGEFPYAEDVPEKLDLEKYPRLTHLLVSHDHKDHCFIPKGVPVTHGVISTKVEDTPELLKIGPFGIGKYSSQHFATDARRPKANAIFVFSCAGLRLVHMADAFGSMATPALLQGLKDRLGEVDVLLFPTGDPWLKRVDTHILMTTLETLQPRLSIPMHYWRVAHKRDSLAELANAGCRVYEFPTNGITLCAEELPEKNSTSIWSLPGKMP